MEKYKIGIATSDGIVVNQHFGRAANFMIVEADPSGKYVKIEDRKIKPVCSGGNHEDTDLYNNVKLLSDCNYLLVSKIGESAAYVLEDAGITPFEIPDLIEAAIQKLLLYVEIEKLTCSKSYKDIQGEN